MAKSFIAVHGWLVLDKPLGLTSTQALGQARRLLNGKKAGHAGTLDPLASGILPLAFGEATKLVPHVMDGDKDYEFTIRWGDARSTDDAEGDVVATSDVRPNDAAIRAALPSFTGMISQTPPAYSAIKLNGERAYDIARAGGAPQMAPRPVMIYTLTYLGAVDADHGRFHVVCGKGMYVRSLARDLAQELGTCGHVTALRRTRVGSFTLDQAVTLEQLTAATATGQANQALLPLKAALGSIPVLTLMPAEAHSLQQGQGVLIRSQHIHLLDAGVIFAEHQGVPVALVEPHAGEFRVVRGFSFN